jgi:uncharacterized membrane protein YGL010W
MEPDCFLDYKTSNSKVVLQHSVCVTMGLLSIVLVLLSRKLVCLITVMMGIELYPVNMYGVVNAGIIPVYGNERKLGS